VLKEDEGFSRGKEKRLSKNVQIFEKNGAHPDLRPGFYHLPAFAKGFGGLPSAKSHQQGAKSAEAISHSSPGLHLEFPAKADEKIGEF